MANGIQDLSGVPQESQSGIPSQVAVDMPQQSPQPSEAELRELLRQQYVNRYSGGLSGLIGLIKNIGVNRQIERYQPQIQRMREKEHELQQRRQKIDLDTREAGLANERANLAKVQEELQKQRGLTALDRVSKSLMSGDEISLEDAEAAQVVTKEDGSLFTNADLLRSKGVDPDKISANNLTMRLLLNNPASPLNQQQLLKAAQDETDFQQKMAEVNQKARDGTLDDLRQDYDSISKMGGRIASQMANIFKAKNEFQMTNREAANLFKESVLPMIRTMNLAAARFGIDATIDAAQLGRAVLANDPVAAGEGLLPVGAINNQVRIEGKKPYPRNAEGVKSRKPPLPVAAKTAEPARKKPGVKAVKELSDEDLVTQLGRR